MIGHVGRPHGVRGAVRARATGPTLAGLAPGAELWAAPRAGEHRLLELEERSGPDSAPILRFAGVASRDEAVVLAGAELLAGPEHLPALADPDTHYVRDLIGYRAYLGDRALGAVRDVHPGPANDALAIAGPDGEVLVPFTADAIVSLDPAARRLTVRPGLLDDGV